MTTTMMAAVVHEFGKPLTIDEVPVPATETLDNINDVFVRMHQGDIQGRVIIDFQK